jgi:uncharacterized protein
MATGPSIDYVKLQQEAMRGVVRAVLQRIVKSGLPGEHHFYISFLTQAPGVILSKRLKEKYPTEMTIVLQHRFWDLIVTDERFEVKLTFDGIPERLVVPFAALKVFIDPSVRYGLQFDEEATEREYSASSRHAARVDSAFEPVGEAGGDTPRAAPKKPRPARKPRADKDSASVTTLTASPSEALPPNPEPATRAGEARKSNAKDGDAAPREKEAASDAGAKILSLDQFRKK